MIYHNLNIVYQFVKLMCGHISYSKTIRPICYCHTMPLKEFISDSRLEWVLVYSAMPRTGKCKLKIKILDPAE